MKRKDILREKFQEFIHENSSLVLETDSKETDVYGDLAGLAVLATRFNHFAVIIVDARGHVEYDELPQYVHICSIDKLLDDAIDVYNLYGHDQEIDINIMDGNEMRDYENELIKFIKILYKDNLESIHLIKFVNDKIFGGSLEIISNI